jgi:hypothetical protein
MASLHFSTRTYPTFGTVKRPKAEYAWKGSVYYWWWEYLRRNDDYKKCCAQNGRGELAELYKDFGDVHAVDFKTWWTEGNRGARLFAEPEAKLLLTELTYEQTQQVEKWNKKEMMVVLVPLNQSKRHLAKRFNTLLKNRHTGERGKRLLERSEAKYPLSTKFKVDSLKTSLAAYDLRISEPELTLWEIAIKAGLAATAQKELNNYKGLKGQKDAPNFDLTNTLSVAASRAIKRAKAMIESTATGGFPNPRMSFT